LVLWTLPAATAEPLIVILGDSLSAAYGIPVDQGWVTLLQTRLRERGHPHRVVNASVSGETTKGGLSRLSTLIAASPPNILVVELGANDGLRGVSLEETRNNLQSIVEAGRNHGARIVLIPMKLPVNYGPAYTRRFEAVYQDLANDTELVLSPFLLEGVADQPALMQEDNMHPRAEAQVRILDNVWPTLERLL
jgi:acyl-CoA thioesterase-1